ncbi:glycoside hydrolase family 18 protein [Lepidopterella palustris CBS 459.81]|uniref:Glycoside hydrolase family 18 protein n=1 Tax=Lepidopterella palustris CBS 459.81 TaxID=1314670 RepID=A0A8E2EIZ0_9PEZI|nr:glycoside hydrolase family 18 protein [Lepidopterella palustris CBS 459.81]
MGMLGGAAKGSFERLSGGDEEFEAYYSPLHAIIQRHNLQGLDLDIEEAVPLSTPTRLLSRLRADFGPSFILTLAPVATALLPDPAYPTPPRPALFMTPTTRTPNPLHPTLPHLSGFSYPALEVSDAGRLISWYNTQFYCGWGDAGSTVWYDAIVAAGWPPSKVVLGVVTNPGNGAGYIDLVKFRNVCSVLRARYEGLGGFGGVMGWEYFNAGGGEQRGAIAEVAGAADGPAGWVQGLGNVLRAVRPPSGSVRAGETGAAGFGQAPALPVPPVPWPGEDVERLIVIGFSRQEAVAALNATDGNVEMAAGLLFER